MKRFVQDALVLAVLAGVVAAVVLVGGFVDFSAANPPSKLERTLAPWLLNRSIARRAPQQSNPSTTAADVARGQSHYQESCLVCHGAPGQPADEIARGLNPPAPPLDGPRLARSSDGRLFYIVKNGIKLTGMPAFGGLYDDGEVWKVVAALRAQSAKWPASAE